MIEERPDPRALAARKWFGYGRWDAPFWFIGKEPGGTDDPARYASWMRLGGADLIDCHAHELEYTGDEVEQTNAWRSLIALLLAYQGATEHDEAAVAAYQANSWGQSTGETAVLELSAIAVRSTTDPEAARLMYLGDRIAHLRGKIAEQKPKFVLFYGLGFDPVNDVRYIKHWSDIAGKALVENEPAKIDGTVFVYAKHPSAYGMTNAFWMDLGNKIRYAVDYSG
jgi:hypothetical protein